MMNIMSLGIILDSDVLFKSHRKGTAKVQPFLTRFRVHELI